ncbi:MAG: glycosyltransferase [Nitrospirae bacterium]|nr:glycosyltransferase [Nitrospirota bacterium]MBF0540176.1 glycosyltransferase [Nitrospirota bacterium]
MDKSPLVSIIIPTFNNADLITFAIESVLAQTYTNYEAIIIDNFSNDNTDDVVARYANVNPRIRYFKYNNQGLVGRARNYGVSQCTGSLIAFLDSDDVWMPDKLQFVVSRFNEDDGIDLICHWEKLRDMGTVTRDLIYGPVSEVTFKKLLFSENKLSPSAVTMKKALFEELSGFDPNIEVKYAEDYDFWLRMTRHGCRIEFIPEFLGEFRITGKNFGNNIDQQLISMRKIIDKHYKQMDNKTIYTDILYRKKIASVYMSQAWANFRADKKNDAYRLIFSGLSVWPFSIKSYISIILFLLNKDFKPKLKK